MKKQLDRLDRRLISLLGQDGRMSPRALADQLEISQPTVNSRIKSLIKEGILKISGLIDTFKADNFITVIVAIQMEDDKQLDEKLEQISSIGRSPLCLCRHWSLRHFCRSRTDGRNG